MGGPRQRHQHRFAVEFAQFLGAVGTAKDALDHAQIMQNHASPWRSTNAARTAPRGNETRVYRQFRGWQRP